MWESIVEYIETHRFADNIIFISNNTKDFADENDKNNLHPLLLEELNNFETKVYYFSHIKDFIEKHSKYINSINSTWLDINTDKNLYAEKIKETIEIIEVKNISDWFEKQNPNLKANGKIRLNNLSSG